jgi:hypothetical protein
MQCCLFGVGLSIMVPSMPRWSTVSLLTIVPLTAPLRMTACSQVRGHLYFVGHSPSYEVAVFLSSFKENRYCASAS